MPLVQTFQCRTCNTVRSIPHGQLTPRCCDTPMKWRQTREHKPEEHGWSTGMKAPAVGFRNTNPWVVPMQNADGSPVAIESLHELRQIEKRTEEMERNGLGQAVRFRAFSQEHSNMQVNTFGAPPHKTPKLFDEQGRQKISAAAVEGDAADAEVLGGGVDAALASALPESPL